MLAFERTKILLDTIAIQKLVTLSDGYIPWTASSIRPSAIVKILNDITINERKNIIEFGSGVSTVFIAKTIRNSGGHLYTVDHDGSWIKVVKKMLKKENLGDVVSFIHAPMNASIFSLNKSDWYDEKKLRALSEYDPFDLIIVYGPLAYTKELRLSRYPALPFLMSIQKVHKNATVILDDIDRRGEQEIISLWEKGFGFRFSLLFKDGGIAVSQNGGRYNI